MRWSAWPGRTIWKRTHLSRYKSGSVISQQRCSVNLSLAAHAVLKWVRRSGHIYARRAAVTVSSTCRNSTTTMWPVGAPFTKLCAWPSVWVVPPDNLCLTDIKLPRSKCYAKPQSRFVLSYIAEWYLHVCNIFGLKKVSKHIKSLIQFGLTRSKLKSTDVPEPVLDIGHLWLDHTVTVN